MDEIMLKEFISEITEDMDSDIEEGILEDWIKELDIGNLDF